MLNAEKLVIENIQTRSGIPTAFRGAISRSRALSFSFSSSLFHGLSTGPKSRSSRRTKGPLRAWRSLAKTLRWSSLIGRWIPKIFEDCRDSFQDFAILFPRAGCQNVIRVMSLDVTNFLSKFYPVTKMDFFLGFNFCNIFKLNCRVKHGLCIA